MPPVIIAIGRAVAWLASGWAVGDLVDMKTNSDAVQASPDYAAAKKKRMVIMAVVGGVLLAIIGFVWWKKRNSK